MTPYIELHAHSHWSLLDGASSVEELMLRAKKLGYEAMALTDHDGLYGAMEFAQLRGEPSRWEPQVASAGARLQPAHLDGEGPRATTPGSPGRRSDQ